VVLGAGAEVPAQAENVGRRTSDAAIRFFENALIVVASGVAHQNYIQPKVVIVNRQATR
jgi:hypothetical protein